MVIMLLLLLYTLQKFRGLWLIKLSSELPQFWNNKMQIVLKSQVFSLLSNFWFLTENFIKHKPPFSDECSTTASSPLECNFWLLIFREGLNVLLLMQLCVCVYTYICTLSFIPWVKMNWGECYIGLIKVESRAEKDSWFCKYLPTTIFEESLKLCSHNKL